MIAFLIIRAEMALFDLKEGFCSTSWGTAKRFCCAPHHRGRPGGTEEACGDWVQWGELFDPKARDRPEGNWLLGGPEFGAYSMVAVSHFPQGFKACIDALGVTARIGNTGIVLDRLLFILRTSFNIQGFEFPRADLCPSGHFKQEKQLRTSTFATRHTVHSRYFPHYCLGVPSEGHVLRCRQRDTGNQDDSFGYVYSARRTWLMTSMPQVS